MKCCYRLKSLWHTLYNDSRTSHMYAFPSSSCGSSLPSVVGHSTTTDWNRRHLASAYGPQFSILLSQWTFSTACTRWPPSSRSSAGFDQRTRRKRMTLDDTHRNTCHRRLPRRRLKTQVNLSGGALSHTWTQKYSMTCRQTMQIPQFMGVQRKINLLVKLLEKNDLV